jgi:hypothetical protein
MAALIRQKLIADLDAERAAAQQQSNRLRSRGRYDDARTMAGAAEGLRAAMTIVWANAERRPTPRFYR